MSTASRLRRALQILFLPVAFSVAAGVAACAEPSDDDEPVEGSTSNLTEESNRIVLQAANTLDEDTLDLDVDLGPQAARAVVTHRPFASIDGVRKILSAPKIRKLLDYARAHGVHPASSASASASAWPSGSGSAWPDSGSPWPSGSGSSAPYGSAWPDASRPLDAGAGD